MKETVAVFGGSFDPPHVAHVLVAAWARATGIVDRVLVIPAFAHAFGKDSVPFAHRLAMAKIAMEGFDFAEVSNIEEELGESRSLHTVQALAKRLPDASFRLLIGSDILAGAHRWYRWDDLVAVAPPLVVGRGGYESQDHELRGHELKGHELALPELSSTAIRERIRTGASTEGLVPLGVARYIEEHGLYR